MDVYSVKKTDSPYFSGYNGVADLKAKEKQVDADIERIKAENGGVIPAGSHGSFIQLEAHDTRLTTELVSHEGNTYNYRVGRASDELQLSEAAKASLAAEAASKPAKGLTDRDIFIIFTGREPMKTKGTPFEGTNAAGSEEWFDEDGNFIHKDDAELIAHYKQFYQLTVFSGVPFSQQSPKHVADFFGNVGKRIDEAYAAGKCTKEQKEQLDKLLSETAQDMSQKTQRRQALLKICREEFNMPVEERKALIESRREMTREERRAERQAQISKYVEKYFKVDNETLFNMINAVRYSNLNVLSLLPKA